MFLLRMVFEDPAEYPIGVSGLQMVMKVQQFLNVQRLLGGGLLLVGALALAFPELLAARAYLLFENPASNIWLIYGLGISLIGLGAATLTEPRDATETASPLSRLLVVVCTLLYFLALTVHLRGWWIDDAGITFAYSRSLAEGLGLVAQPWLPPEEGYSSFIWMLVLSAAHRLGADIPLVAKYLGIGCTTAAMGLCAWILARETRSPFALMICGVGIACAPTVVWAVSGQEHALQSLLLLLVVLCVYTLEQWRWPVAVILALFVLTRPEAPIIVIAVFCAAVYLTRRAGGPLFNAADAAVALLPFAAFCALIAFRLTYFGDPMPNPYYAKSSGAGLVGLFNPLGGGWTYILSGLRNTALLFILWLAFLIPARQQPSWVVIATAVLAGHIVFVVWAKGDWMSQYRFLMPVLPVALLVISLGLQGLAGFWKRFVFCVAAVLILTHTAVLQMAAFKENPTTPLAVVTEVGNTFHTLAKRLEIEDPLLAHHDAGGIAYHRMIRLVDLGGLINRTIAKNMDDKAFLTTYLLEELRPDFVFGAKNFAAASGFSGSDVFTRDYVRLEFADRPDMQSDLSYIRRDLVLQVPGVELIYDDSGILVRVLVHGRDSAQAGKP